MPLFTALLAYLGLRQPPAPEPILTGLPVPGARPHSTPRYRHPYFGRGAPAGDVIYDETWHSPSLVGLPIRRSPGGEVIGEVISERGSAEGLVIAGRLQEALGIDLGLLPWQGELLGGMSFGPFRSPPRGPGEMPASLEPAEVERWRVASGLPAQLGRRAEQLDALRADLERLALETRWGSSAGRLAFAAFVAAGGPALTPWQGFEAALKFVSTYSPGGLEDDRPSSV